MSNKTSKRQCHGQVGATRGQGGPRLCKRTMLLAGYVVGRSYLRAMARWVRRLSDRNLAQQIYTTHESLRIASKQRGLATLRCTVRRISKALAIAKRELNRRKS